MQHRHRGCEALAEAADELRGEPDLRHQHQHAAPGCEHARHELQIHLGLAAAGDPVQHECGVVTQRRADRGHRLGLLAGKLRPRSEHARARGRLHRGHGAHRQPSASEQCAGGLAPGGQAFVEHVHGARAGSHEELEERALLAGPPRFALRKLLRPGRGDDPLLLLRPRGRPPAQRLGQRTRDDLTDGVVVVVRRPGQKRKRGRIEHRLAVEHLQHCLEALGGQLRVIRACHNEANQTLAAERHPHAHPGGDRTGAAKGWVRGSRTVGAGGCRAPPAALGSQSSRFS